MDSAEIESRIESGTLTEEALGIAQEVLLSRDTAYVPKFVEAGAVAAKAKRTGPADLRQRIAAKAIDLGVSFLVAFGVAFVCDLIDIPTIVAGYMWLVYILMADSFSNGQSFGKTVLRIRVVSHTTGKPCTVIQSVVRNLFLFVCIFDLILYYVRKRRIGDYAANTDVVQA